MTKSALVVRLARMYICHVVVDVHDDLKCCFQELIWILRINMSLSNMVRKPLYEIVKVDFTYGWSTGQSESAYTKIKLEQSTTETLTVGWPLPGETDMLSSCRKKSMTLKLSSSKNTPVYGSTEVISYIIRVCINWIHALVDVMSTTELPSVDWIQWFSLTTFCHHHVVCWIARDIGESKEPCRVQDKVGLLGTTISFNHLVW